MGVLPPHLELLPERLSSHLASASCGRPPPLARQQSLDQTLSFGYLGPDEEALLHLAFVLGKSCQALPILQQ